MFLNITTSKSKTDATKVPDAQIGVQHLLVVGISEYENHSLLKTAQKDAVAIKAALVEKYGFKPENTVELYDDQATAKQITKTLESYTSKGNAKLHSEDSLVIYFSGHGHFDPVSQEISIIPHEDEDEPEQALVSYGTIKSLLGEIEARQILFISDACYSGGLLKGFYANFDPAEIEYLEDHFDLTCRQAISSGGLEVVSDKGFGSHSVFCHFALKTLRENKAHTLPAGLLFKRIDNALRHNYYQTPKFGSMHSAGGEGGQFIFCRPSAIEEITEEKSVNPFKGLKAFGIEDADYFGGRDEIANEVYNKLVTHNLVGIIGASGSGKSSLALAGVCPIVLEKQPTWKLLNLRIGAKPIENLFYALDHWLFSGDMIDRPQRIQKFLQNLKEDPSTLYHYLKSGMKDSQKTPILVLDQWEEIYTLCNEETEREAFFSNLIYAIQEDVVRVLLTVRADFYDQLLLSQIPFFDLLKPGLIDLKPMTSSELKEAIEKPAELSGLSFSNGLVERLLADVEGEKGHLPILQFALSELWQNRDRKTNTINFEIYEELGGLKGVIKKQADKVVDEELSDEERKIAQLTLPSLVHLGGHGNDIKIREPLSHYSKDQQNILRKLSQENCRLVTIDREANLDNPDQETEYVELAHEELIRSWPALSQWLQDDIEFHKQRSRLQNSHQDYLDNIEKEDYLLPEGKPLEDAKYLLADYGNHFLSQELQTYIEKSNFKWERIRQKKLDDERKKRAQEHFLRKEAELSAAKAKFRTVVAACLFFLTLVGVATTSYYYFVAESEAIAANYARAQAETEKSIYATAISDQLLDQDKIDQALKVVKSVLRKGWHKGELVNKHIAYSGFLRGVSQYSNDKGILRGHKGDVLSARFSSDGKIAVTASTDKTAKIWSVETGQLIHTLKGHTKAVRNAEFSPDSKNISTISYDNTTRLWSVETGQLIHTIKGSTSFIESARFSPDSKTIVTASSDETGGIWSTKTGQLIHNLKGHKSFVNSARFSPDGKSVVTASRGGTARIWNTKTGKLITVLKGHTSSVGTAEFSPNGKAIITTSLDGTARIWSVDTGALIHILTDHESPVYHGQFSPDGKTIVTDSRDGPARIWNVKTGDLVYTLKDNNDNNPEAIFSRKTYAQFSPNGKTVAIASRGKGLATKIWDMGTGQLLHTLEGHQYSVNSVHYSPGGKAVLTASRDKTARIWSIETGQLNYIFKDEVGKSLFQYADFSPDGKMIVTASGDIARTWSVETGKVIHILKDNKDIVTYAQFSPNGKTIVTTTEELDIARIWDAESGRLIHILRGQKGPVQRAQFSLDGKTIVIASQYDQAARIWSVKTGEVIRSLKGHKGDVTSVDFSPDGATVATASGDKTARIWNVDTGQPIHILKGHKGDVNSVDFSPNGNTIATASGDKTVRIWNVDTGQPIHILKGHKGDVNSVDFSPDGNTIVTVSVDKSARIWEVKTGDIIHTLEIPNSTIWSAQFSRDSETILTTSNDKLVRIWGAKTGQVIHKLRGHKNIVPSAKFSPNGKAIVTASYDSTIRIWTFPFQIPIFEKGKLRSKIVSPFSKDFGKRAMELFPEQLTCQDRQQILKIQSCSE